jgi:hypothetical protein
MFWSNSIRNHSKGVKTSCSEIHKPLKSPLLIKANKFSSQGTVSFWHSILRALLPSQEISIQQDILRPLTYVTSYTPTYISGSVTGNSTVIYDVTPSSSSTFRRNVMPQSSGSKSKASKKPVTSSAFFLGGGVYSSTVKVKCSFETSADVYRTTRR